VIFLEGLTLFVCVFCTETVPPYAKILDPRVVSEGDEI
jgi:hypothetical protein